MGHWKTPIDTTRGSEFVFIHTIQTGNPIFDPRPVFYGKGSFCTYPLIKNPPLFLFLHSRSEKPIWKAGMMLIRWSKRCFTELKALGFNSLFDGVMFLWLFGNIQITNNHEHNSRTGTTHDRSPCLVGTKFGNRRVNPSGTNRRRVHLSL